MNLKELRVGNLVMYEDGGILEIENVSEFAVNGSGWSDTHYGIQNGGFDWGPSADEVFGIPLTEEWLIKFGSRVENGKRLIYIFTLESYEDNGLVWDVLLMGIVVTKLKYVHQFQNLYFAFIGHEFIINE